MIYDDLHHDELWELSDSKPTPLDDMLYYHGIEMVDYIGMSAADKRQLWFSYRLNKEGE